VALAAAVGVGRARPAGPGARGRGAGAPGADEEGGRQAPAQPAQDAAARGAGRYEFLARAVLGLADPSVPAERLAPVIVGLSGCAVLDGWPLVAALAAARRSDPLRAEAERLAEVVIGNAGDDADAVRRFVGTVLTASRR
jgi:hypothetical protein